jgi:hypothetical protein
MTMTVGMAHVTDLEHAMAELGKNYDIVRAQAARGFTIGSICVILGTCVILLGAVGQLFGSTYTASALTIAAGAVIETIAGVGFYLFRQTSRQLTISSRQLLDVWRILAAFRKAESLPSNPNDDVRTNVTVELIHRLAAPSPAQAIPDALEKNA